MRTIRITFISDINPFYISDVLRKHSKNGSIESFKSNVNELYFEVKLSSDESLKSLRDDLVKLSEVLAWEDSFSIFEKVIIPLSGDLNQNANTSKPDADEREFQVGDKVLLKYPKNKEVFIIRIENEYNPISQDYDVRYILSEDGNLDYFGVCDVENIIKNVMPELHELRPFEPEFKMYDWVYLNGLLYRVVGLAPLAVVDKFGINEIEVLPNTLIPAGNPFNLNDNITLKGNLTNMLCKVTEIHSDSIKVIDLNDPDEWDIVGLEYKNLWFTNTEGPKAYLASDVKNDTGIEVGDIVTSSNAAGFEFSVRSIDPSTDNREALIYVDGLMDGMDYGFIYVSDINSIRKPGTLPKASKPFTAKEKETLKAKFKTLMDKRKYKVNDTVIMKHANVSGNTYEVIAVYDQTPSFIKIKSNQNQDTKIIDINDVFLA